jgi:predicted MFS family arabinose efflux permease
MFLSLGVGEIFGGYFSGTLSDKLNTKKVGAIALASYTISLAMSLLAVDFCDTVVPVMIAAFFWGFQ